MNKRNIRIFIKNFKEINLSKKPLSFGGHEVRYWSKYSTEFFMI